MKPPICKNCKHKSCQLDATLLQLIRQGYIEVFTVNGEDRYRLTPKGTLYLKQNP